MRQSYRSDLTDEQWEVIKTLIPPAKTGGRPRTVDMRRVIDGIFGVAGSRYDYPTCDCAPRTAQGNRQSEIKFPKHELSNW